MPFYFNFMTKHPKEVSRTQHSDNARLTGQKATGLRVGGRIK